jgi:hypothetical protein
MCCYSYSSTHSANFPVTCAISAFSISRAPVAQQKGTDLFWISGDANK